MERRRRPNLDGDNVLTPEGVLDPHATDKGPGVCSDGWSTDGTTSATTPDELSQRTVPSENRLGSDDGDGGEKRGEQLGDGANGQAVVGPELRAWDGSAKDDDLLAEPG
jgi:hypothetical protein